MSDTELQELVINEAESDEVVEQQTDLAPNQVIITPSGSSKEYSSEADYYGLPVGSIFASAIPVVDARVHLLDGSLITQSGIYEEFAILIKTLVSFGQPINCTQDEFDTDVSATGNCGKFVIDDTAGTIRLPKITTFIQGLSNIADIGKSLEAGLPSITHTHPQYITANSGAYMGRQDYSSDRSNSDVYPHVDTGTNSAVSPIYGKSDTIQPNATQFPYYIVLAAGYKQQSQLNVDNIMNDVNGLVGQFEQKPWLNDVYPVGSIYLTLNDNGSPAKIFGGTWERLDSGKALWTASSGAGNTIAAGLPNISGSIYIPDVLRFSTGPGSMEQSGALSFYQEYKEKAAGGGSSHSRYKVGFTFNANDGSVVRGIYGNAYTVQPPAYKVYAYKRIE